MSSISDNLVKSYIYLLWKSVIAGSIVTVTHFYPQYEIYIMSTSHQS